MKKHIILLVCFLSSWGLINAGTEMFIHYEAEDVFDLPNVNLAAYTEISVGGIGYGINSYNHSSDWRWEIENGKIKDKNGNYTLTTKVLDSDDPDQQECGYIEFMWNGSETAKTGKLYLRAPDDLMSLNYPQWREVEIQPINKQYPIQNRNIVSNFQDEGMNLIMENVTVSNNTIAKFKGYRSINVQNNVIVKVGVNANFSVGFPEKSYTPRALIVKKMEDFDENDNGINLINVNLLEQNYPNPFKEYTQINYNISNTFNEGYIQFFNSLGGLYKIVPIYESGEKSIYFDSSGMPDGIYYYSLIVDGKLIDTKKMIKH